MAGHRLLRTGADVQMRAIPTAASGSAAPCVVRGARCGYDASMRTPSFPCPRLAFGLCLLLFGGCSGGGAGDTDGTQGTTGTAGTAGTGDCPLGTQGCPCSAGGACGDGLACVGGTCVAPTCGDGVVQEGEACDAGPANADTGVCKTDCTPQTCGDGFVGPGEGCDDGNDVDDDGCTNDCKLPTCGDGVLQGAEACDDGNDVDDDGCTNACTLPSCGDGIVQAGEACDDGNAKNDDACVVGCEVATCGDGFVWSGMEACDDGNDDDDDLCRADCTPAECGDGIVQPPAGEACDDGNDVDDDDTCTNACTVPECGDQIVQAGLGEACDDGKNGAIDDGCTDACLVAPVGIVLSEDPNEVTSPDYVSGMQWDTGATWKPNLDAAPQAIRGFAALFSAVTQNCGPDPVVVATKVRAAPPTLADAGGVPGVASGAEADFGTVGFSFGAMDADPSLRLCPDGQWLVGIEATGATYIHSVRLQCAPLEIVEEGNTYAVHTGAITTLPSAGGSGGSLLGSVACPADYVVGHFFVRWDTEEGCHIALGIVCNKVKLVFP
ncbi:MAG: DUF4215 domain-containing protein [Deltaproteobacteria bacterium]|nr:MAG: DUF4215 domain-containing protein [Deltaproteobacteria bacterium]